MRSGNRQIALITLLAVLASILAACGGAPAAGLPATPAGSPPTPVVQTVVVQQTVVVEQVVERPVIVTPTAAPTTEATEELAADQTLRYVTRNFSRLDPASEGGFGRFVISHLWMPLFLRDTKGNLQPWLATEYEASEDGTVYTVKIDPRAVWSDGTPVTAQEAKDYWTYGLDPKRCETCYLSAFSGLEVIEGAKEIIDGTGTELTGVVAKDEKTIEFTLTGPDPIFINRLALFDTGFAKMEDVNKGPEYAADGTARVNGPFMVKAWNLETKQFEIVQNPQWWGDKKPTITRIVAQDAADENVSFVQWQNNEVDVAQWLTNIREPLREENPEQFYQIPYATNFFFPLWISVEPMDDLNLRRALAFAVDWESAVGAAWEGARDDRLMTGILTPELACYKANNWPDWGYDPAKAKEELAASKYGSVDNLPKIRITTAGQSPNYIRMAEIIAEQWRTNLGITDVEIKPGPLDAWGQEQDQVQVRRSSAGAIIPDPLNFISSHYNSYAGGTTGEGSGLVDDEVGAMIEELRVMPRDDPQFCPMVQEAEAKLLGNYYMLPMIWDRFEYAVKPWVKNFGTNVDNNWYTLLDIYIVKH
jgi:peptide/nickel transport system substrate-binding protein